MTYLYAVLGLLMMSGIIAIFNMSLKITSQPIESIIPENKYQNNRYNLKDKIFLELLLNSNKSWGFGDTLCNKIKTEINDVNNNFDEVSNYNLSEKSPSTDKQFLGGCVFSNENHRILIKPKDIENSSYYYFSCFALLTYLKA